MEQDLDEQDSDDVEPSAMTPLQMQEWDNVTYLTYYQEEEKKLFDGLKKVYRPKDFTCHDGLLGQYVDNLTSVWMNYKINKWEGAEKSVDDLRKRFIDVSLPAVFEHYVCIGRR